MKKIITNCVLVLLLVITAAESFGQRMYYSEKERNGLISKYTIIGKVKDHIIIWITKNDNPKDSRIMVYDDEMHSVNEVKSDVLGTGRFYDVNFINSKDSFQLIYQYISNNNYLCKRIVFDDLGYRTSTETLDSIHVKSDSEFVDYDCMVMQSANKQNFVLMRVISNGEDKADFQYNFFVKNERYNNHFVLPFTPGATNINGLLLDDNNNLVINLSNHNNTSEWLSVYKINLKNNAVINSLRKLNDGFFITRNTAIVATNNQYILSAECVNDSATGIFVWNLNSSDLTDQQKDSVFIINSNTDSAFKGLYAFQKNEFAEGGDANMFLSSKNNREFVSLMQSNGPNKTTHEDYNPFQHVNDELTAMDRINHSYIFSSANNSYTDNQYKASDLVMTNDYALKNPGKLKLVYLKVNANNRIEYTQAFDGLIDPAVISKVNNAQIYQSGPLFNILFEQLSGKETTIGYIKLNSNNNATEYRQLNLMHLRYHLLIDEAVQINSDEIIVPGSFQNKFVFTKISFN